MRPALLPVFLLLAGLLAAPALAADPSPQPRLDGRWHGLAAQDVAAGLWWAGPAQRDASGPDTLAEALAGVPGLIFPPAPGNGSAALIVRHGRSQPELRLGLATQPGLPPLLTGLFDADLLLAAPPGGLGGAAGEISLSLRRPGDRLAGLGEFATGAFGSRRVLARIDVPLGKGTGGGVRLGLGGHLQHDLGWLQNTTTGERLNRGQRAGVSGTLDVDLAPTLSLALTSLHARSRAGNLPAFACDPNAPATCGGRFASTGQLARPPLLPAPRWGAISADLASQPLGQRVDLALYDLRLVHQGQRLRLELAAGLSRQTGQLGLDLADGRRLAALAVPAGLASGGYGLIARTADSQHGADLLAAVDLGVLTLRGGAGFSEARRRRDQADTQAGTVLADRRLVQSMASRHAFAQARLEPGHGLALEAGVRAARQTLGLDVTDRRAGCAPCLAPAGPARQEHTLVTPEFALSWRASSQWLLFVRSARSARLPGWNLLARTSAELQLLPAETGWHHQAGVKADLWGGRLRLDASGFAARTRALVSPLLGIDPLALAAIPRLDMQNHGLDVTAQARPLEQLELVAALGWQQARWTGPTAANLPPGAPGRPLYAPDTTASLSAAWRQPLVGTGSVLVPRVGLRWRSAMAVAAGPVLGLAGGIADGLAPGGWQVAAALQLEIPDGGWLISLECENCLDQTLTDGAVAGLPTLNPPRWWQLRFTRRF